MAFASNASKSVEKLYLLPVSVAGIKRAGKGFFSANRPNIIASARLKYRSGETETSLR